MAKILVVEDNPEQASLLASMLRHEQHVVDVAETGEDAIQLLKHQNYELMILDWELPGEPGVAVCKQYRSSGGQAPVLMLTGRSDVNSKAFGLDHGADDYLTKPYDFIELAARVRSLLRRPATVVSNKLGTGPLSLEVETRTATINGKSIQLTAREAALLEFLLRHLNRSYSSKDLLASVWPADSDVSEDTVRSCMRLLRGKLAAAGGENIIKTVPGFGYSIESQ